MIAEKICWEDLLRRSAEKICWENLLRRFAEKICWEDLLRSRLCWKISFFFLRGWVWLTKTGDHPLVTSCSSEKICWKLWWNANLDRWVNWLCSSDVQNCGEMRSLLRIAVATLKIVTFCARRTSKTGWNANGCLCLLYQPSRRFVLVGRPKLWWNANFEQWPAQPSRHFVLVRRPKLWYLNADFCMPRVALGLRALDSYIFAHATVVKRTFWNFGWHAVVARRTFCFCWMQPSRRIRWVDCTKLWGETQIFCGNCRKHRAKRLVLEVFSVKFVGRQNVVKRSFWNLLDRVVLCSTLSSTGVVLCSSTGVVLCSTE